MNYKLFGIIALLGLVLNGVMAQSLNELDEQVKSTYKNVRSNYITAKNVYETARQDYVSALSAYKRVRNADNLADAKSKAINFLTHAADRGIRQLEWLKVRIENLNGISDDLKATIVSELDSDIEGLVNIKEEVSNEEITRQEIVDIARRIKDKWDSSKAAIKRITGHILIGRVNYVVRKAEKLYDTVNDRAAILEENGKNITKLQTWLDEFGSNIEIAKERLEEGKEKFNEIKTVTQADNFFRAANQFVTRANSYVRKAYVRLVRIAKELKKDEYSISTPGRSWLYAYGNGTAKLEGNGTVLAKTSTQGSVLVQGDDLVVNARGTGSKIVIDNGSTLYEGYGAIRIKGTNLDVDVNGTDIHLVAHGKGSATLTGNGTYKKGRTWFDWSTSGAVIEVGEE